MSDCEDYDLEQARHDVCEDLRGRIAEVSLSFFKKSVLPPLNSEELDNIVAATEHLVIDNRWKAFPKDPAHAEVTENAFFASLPELFKDIVQTASPVLGRKPTEASWQAAVARPSVSFDPENALPASCKVNGARFTLESNRIVQSHSLPTRNVINPSTGPSFNKAFDVAWLYEVDLQDILDNRSKLILAATDVMYNNLSRRFTFALTIENRKARLWFFSRFLIMSTVDFD